MKAKVKRQWLEALRSGTYTQGRGHLRNHESYCCLGVLCDLHAKTTKKVWGKSVSSLYHYDGAERSLPPIVKKWSGLKDDYCDIKALEISLAVANDRGHSFLEIADLIEQYF